MSVDGPEDRTPGRSPRSLWRSSGNSGARAGGRSSLFGAGRRRWDNIIPLVAAILAVILAAFAVLAQKRFLSQSDATIVGSTYSTNSAPSAASTTKPSFPHLVHTIGHSFTSNGAEADSVAKLLGASWAHTTSGVGGESARAIAARAGAIPWDLHPEGGRIPASGKVEVALYQDGQPFPSEETWPLVGNGAGENTRGTGQNNEGISGILGNLAGVNGRLLIDRPAGTVRLTKHLEGDRYYFERESPGDVVDVEAAPFLPSYGPSQVDGVVLISAARNSLPRSDISDVIATVDKIIGTIPSDRWLVLAEWSEFPVTSDAGNKVADYNDQAKQHWGDHFVDTYTFAREEGMAYLKLAPTAEDVQDIAEGKIPRTLQLEDHLHPNQRGYDVIARAVVDQMVKLGFAPSGA
ncbi:MAG: hypothetical protein IPH03_10485 [Tetrasphaera sp.]|jgi:hypothetical protein|nr:hypothetical protein [Tetrasphaera sp.]